MPPALPVKAAEGSLLPQFSASASVARNYRNTVPEFLHLQ